MKSFQDHINFTDTLRKPVYRSSAIFPFILEKNIDTKIIFLSYWFLKRKITEVSLLITIRNIDGKIIKRSIDKINCVKSYNISLKELLLRNNLSRGSIELEIFSTEDMVFPFPAFSINLVSRECTTSVHSCGRIYNDFDDFISNSKIIVPESGFDILPDKNLKPFFSFVNGPLKLKNSEKYFLTRYTDSLCTQRIDHFDYNAINYDGIFIIDFTKDICNDLYSGQAQPDT